MTDNSLLGRWVRRFLLEHLVTERNLARNTQYSYRDTLVLLIPFIVEKSGKQIEKLKVTDVTPELVRQFLLYLEQIRGSSMATRNQRLTAIHALARFIGLHSPEHIEWSGQISTIPFKKAEQSLITYLEKNEMDVLLAAPDRNTAQGRRDYALLLFLYNTGARADEAAQLRITDLDLAQSANQEYSSVRIRGKGNKVRCCPLWATTVNELKLLIEGRSSTEHVFLNRCHQPITRFGIHNLVERYVKRVLPKMPSLANKRVSPHVLRHTTASHLLRAGVDINTIRAWLGHVSLATTNIYAEIDLEMKAKALARCEVKDTKPARSWRENQGLMSFLRAL
jgi:site-specific recombinase XerD